MRELQTALSRALKQEFQQDLELFKHLLLLLNNSGPVRNVELMWHEELDPTKQRFKDRVGTKDALIQLQPPGTAKGRNSPSTLFCDLVHGFGAHEEETCARSDEPAKERCRATGCTQVYACHVGLTDIAIPVTCDGQYLGTLFSGQVLTRPPTPEGFEFVRKNLAGHAHIDFAALERAYYRVPVIAPAQLAEVVRVLELFARYIGNSWKRLQMMSELQRSKDRQLALDRKELAAILLSGDAEDSPELQLLVGRAGLARLPDRVLVVQMHQTEDAPVSRTAIAQQMTLSRLSHMIEDSCQSYPNTLAMIVRPGEICVFTSQEARNPNHERISLEEMAQSILDCARLHSVLSARIGISQRHAQSSELVRAYHEACAALDSRDSEICLFEVPTAVSSRPIEHLNAVLDAIRQEKPVAPSVREFLASAMPADHSTAHLQQCRALLTWAVEHVSLEVISLGVESGRIVETKQRAVSAVLHAPTPFVAGEAFRRFVELSKQQVADLFSQREQKIVSHVNRILDERGPAHVSIQDLAAALQLSAGHLSRVIRRNAGITLEEFLIRRRVELAKKMLLDPRLNVAQVAERCGFCNPAYFASVFKKYVHRTPREFARTPHPVADSASFERSSTSPAVAS
ncbi:MAG TPA: PocR ligand-binding domain-containing protein [Bryobacteraceae bacterium]